MLTPEERLTEFDKTLSSVGKDVEQIKAEIMALRAARHKSNEHAQAELLTLEIVKKDVDSLSKSFERQDLKLTKLLEALIGDGVKPGLVAQVDKIQTHLTAQDVRILAIETLFNGSTGEPGLIKRFDRQEVLTGRWQKIMALVLGALVPLVLGLVWAKITGH